MKLNEIIRNLNFDVRLLEWNLKHGVIKPDELKAYLASLPDSSDDAEFIQMVELTGD